MVSKTFGVLKPRGFLLGATSETGLEGSLLSAGFSDCLEALGTRRVLGTSAFLKDGSGVFLKVAPVGF